MQNQKPPRSSRPSSSNSSKRDDRSFSIRLNSRERQLLRALMTKRGARFASPIMREGLMLVIAKEGIAA